MPLIELKHSKKNGSKLRAVFNPDKGMNLISFKRDEIEVIDQSTLPLFEERFAGLGALIGPHFHHRKPAVIPRIQDESLFPHIARVKAKGVQEPFSHGIGRYAPWQAEFTETGVKARLSGKDLWNGVPLAALEGQNFAMQFNAQLQEQGLNIQLSIVSDTASLVGIHYYYALPGGKGRVISEVQNQVHMGDKWTAIPSTWKYDTSHCLEFPLNEEADFTFRPAPDPLRGCIRLETDLYHLQTTYDCICEENCWQLYHPKEASFVCIEPISARDPRHPNLTVSSLNIHLEILTPSNDL